MDCGSRQVDLLTLIPIYPEEVDYKLEHGAEALLDALDRAGIGDLIDPARPSAIAANAEN